MHNPETNYFYSLAGELMKPIELKARKARENCGSKKIIGEKELERYIAEGWDVQTILPSGKILVRK
jgi:hypothetical protein